MNERDRPRWEITRKQFLWGTAAVAGGLALPGTPPARAADVARASSPTAPSFVDQVNPFVGTLDAGQTFPGAVAPFGMVQVSPDTPYDDFDAVGYRYDDEAIKGFSHTHLSVGCTIAGDVPFMPTVGEVTSTSQEDYRSPFRHDAERASPGYYAVTLDRYRTDVELTASERVGWHRYTFPANERANVLVNVGESLGPEFDAEASVVGEDTVEGFVTSGNFCAAENRYTVYFSARFSRPFTEFGTWDGGDLHAGSRRATGPDAGAYVTFDTTEQHQVVAAVGLSYVSVEGARGNRAAEADGSDFDRVRELCRRSWDRHLGAVEISGATAEQRSVFYTAMYHAMLLPSVFSDADGRYPGFDGKVRTARDRVQYATFSMWDTYRAQHQLLALLVPSRARDMMASLLATSHEEGGWLPQWSLYNAETNIMTGDNVTPVLVDGYFKGLLAGREQEAYDVLRRNATERPPTDSQFVGRVAAPDYERLGYVPHDPQHEGKPGDDDYHNGGSATLEYALADAGLSLMATSLGHHDDARMFAERAHNYRNLWDGRSGFFRPRHRDGSFLEPFEPKDDKGFHEGTAHQYLWLAPQDVDDLVNLLGGRQRTNERLDAFFAYDQVLADPERTAREVWVNGPYDYDNADKYNPNNEPNLQSPYTYLWTGQPWKTQAVVRAAETLFTTGPAGIPGNDDAGTMSAWYVLSCLGIYPVWGGADFYGLTSPLFARTVVHLDPDYYEGATLVVNAPKASEQNRFVRSLTVNGRPWNRAWIDHALLRSGAELTFELGSRPRTAWASAAGQAPPSLSRRSPAQ